MSMDLGELDLLQNGLLLMAQREFPQQTKKFLCEEGKKLNKKAKTIAKKKVGKRGKSTKKKAQKERYLSGFKYGKVYPYPPTGSYAIRVYNSRPHAHLLEYGHDMKPHTRRRIPKRLPMAGKSQVEGRHVLEQAADAFRDEYENDVEQLIDDLLDTGLGV